MSDFATLLWHNTTESLPTPGLGKVDFRFFETCSLELLWILPKSKPVPGAHSKYFIGEQEADPSIYTVYV